MRFGCVRFDCAGGGGGGGGGGVTCNGEGLGTEAVPNSVIVQWDTCFLLEGLYMC